MRAASALFGLAALIPAATNAVPAAPGSLLVPLCGGDGQVRMVELPLDGGPQPDPSACCVKGCHGGSSRKRLARHAEPGS